MSGTADTSLAPILVGEGDDLRTRIETAYEATYKRTIRYDTLDALELIVSWLRRGYADGEDVVHTTLPEAFRDIGWPVAGRRRHDLKHRMSLVRRLDMLVEMGWLDSWEPIIRADGLGVGIVICSRRDSSVGRALDSAGRRLTLLDADGDEPEPPGSAAPASVHHPRRPSSSRAGSADPRVCTIWRRAA